MQNLDRAIDNWERQIKREARAFDKGLRKMELIDFMPKPDHEQEILKGCMVNGKPIDFGGIE